MRRNELNKNLPSRWRIIRGVYYYDVPPKLLDMWKGKKLYRLGDTFEAARLEFLTMTSGNAPKESDTDLLPDWLIVKSAARIHDAGVYFLIKNNEIVYIGRSNSILNRVSNHIGRFEFDSVFTIPAEYVEQVRLEQRYISKYNPINNIAFCEPEEAKNGKVS